jgi:hypothetical protein
MRLEAPPSRYRVIERGGRLVVIDSQSGTTPLRARDLLPAVTDGAAPRYVDYPTDDDAPAPTPAAVLEAPRSALTPPPNRSLAPEAPGALRSVAATVAGDRRDDQGRLLLTTARWYDAKAPRTLALTKAGEQQLGGAMIALIVAAVVALFLVMFGSVVGWMIVFATVFAAGRAKPAVTAWLDRLAR